ncbi:GYF domain protein [Xylariales sp. AK1849]|nr:GYF domain protein [Xylariales sp. AK1849]
MSSRFSAARPKRAGENYARVHHGEAESDSKKVKFDVRNPSALAPDTGEDADDGPDAYLEADADVIRGSAATKRGAVNIDGYDSDSDREEFGARNGAKSEPKKDVDDLDDMFAEEDGDEKDDTVDNTTLKKSKEVRFLDAADIEGQDLRSKGGGHVRLDDEDSDDDDEEAIELAIQEEGLDEEVGAGGLKKHAPKVEAFNLKSEEEEGRFDEAGNFVRKAADQDALHDRWLEGVSKKDMKKAAEAHEKREAEIRQKRREDDDILTADLLKSLVLRLESSETALEALARLGRSQTKPKKVPKWKQKKQKQESMNVETGKEDPEQTRIKDGIDAITDAADKLLGRDRPDIYDRQRELLVREWSRETQERWVEPDKPEEAEESSNKMWEYRWVDGRDDAAKQGPYDGPTMKAWQDAGYFGEGVEFRAAGDESWYRVVNFV